MRMKLFLRLKESKKITEREFVKIGNLKIKILIIYLH